MLVSAAISLAEPIQILARRFETRTGVAVTLKVDGSDALTGQAINGSPVDVFVSDDEAQMDRLAVAGLLGEGTRVRLLSNRLVVVVPASSNVSVSVPGSLSDPSIRRLALGAPDATAAGRHATAYLQARGVWSEIESRIVLFPHVRAVTAAVEMRVADAGFVYLTDARVAKGLRVALEIDEDPRWVIAHSMAVLRRAPQPDVARAFAAFLREPASLQVFSDAGFVVPTVDGRE